MAQYWEIVGGAIIDDPVAVWTSDGLHVVVLGADGNYYHKSSDGSHWSPSAPGDWDALGRG